MPNPLNLGRQEKKYIYPLIQKWQNCHPHISDKGIGGHGTLQKYRGTGTRYFAKISTAVPVLLNQKYRGSTAVLLRYFFKKLKEKKLD